MILKETDVLNLQLFDYVVFRVLQFILDLSAEIGFYHNGKLQKMISKE